MRITTTVGQEYSVATTCAYCQLSTAGQHQTGCPNKKLISYRLSSPATVIIKVEDLSGKQWFEKVLVG